MVINFLLLFFTVIAAGSLVLFFPNYKERYYKLALVFAGSYLFSITILHLIPELFSSGFPPHRMGLWILLGFILQQILDYLSSGIEHGHLQHGENRIGAITIMVGLFLHAFLEGTLLSHSEIMGFSNHIPNHDHSHNGSTILLGILIHKGPAAFALAAVLINSLSKKWATLLLVIFALASPLGMISSSVLYDSGLLNREGVIISYGLVAGGFLHISTTIFFESSPHHKIKWNKLFVSLLAAGLAIASEFLI